MPSPNLPKINIDFGEQEKLGTDEGSSYIRADGKNVLEKLLFSSPKEKRPGL
jgi:hypothetical protein